MLKGATYISLLIFALLFMISPFSTEAHNGLSSDLPRRNYTFQVQAVDRDLSYSETPVQVAAKVRLSYRTIGLWSIAIISLGLSVWNIVQIFQRGRKLRAARDELGLRVIERTAELSRSNKMLQEEITEREMAEEALRESEEKYRMLIENANEAILLVQDGELRFANIQIEQLVGYSRDELISRPFVEFIHPDDRDTAAELHAKELNGEETPHAYQLRIIDKDGKTKWVEASATSVTWAGKPATLNFLSDITERRKAEEAYRTLVEHSLQGLVILQDDRIVFANSTAAQIAGYTAEELTPMLLGRSMSAFTYPEDRASVQELLQRCLVDETAPKSHEFRIARRDGEVRWIEGFTSRIEYDGKPAVQTAFVDITERKEVEEELLDSNLRLEETIAELQATQRQIIRQERLRALGQLASGIAHDFNNTLMSILGCSELLLSLPGVLDNREETRDYLKLINTAAGDAKNIVSRLSEFYRPRREDDVFTSIDLNQLVEESIQLTRPKWKDQAQASGITIDIKTELSEIPSINGNRTELREMLTNLILNAVDATATDGTIALRTRTGDEAIALEVSDTGKGMAEEVRLNCFEPFFSTKGDRGTGLGLSMVHGIVRRHNGAIQVESELGKGTTFIVHLPWAEQHREDVIREVEARIPPLHVLVVDDEPIARNIVVRYLTTDGHTCEAAHNGYEGLRMLSEGRFDLVITDRAMPDMDGTQLATLIKQTTPEVPIIMLTGFGDMMKASGEMPEGVDILVSKPITLTKFQEALAQTRHSI